jgi:hypothetical protein
MRSTIGRTLALIVALGVMAGAAAPVAAQKHGLTVLTGLHLGGQFEDPATDAYLTADPGLSLGLIFGLPLGNDRTLEVVWTHEFVHVPAPPDEGVDVDLSLDTIGVGGTYEWGDGKVRPFVSGTVGFALLNPDASGYDLELLLSGTLGGGIKVPISQRAYLRLEGRGIVMLATTSAAGICGGGSCVLGFSGAGLGQLELLAGLAFFF